MEGDKQHNGEYSRTAILEDSGNEGGGVISKCVHSELCSNLLVQEEHLTCNNCAPGNTLLEQEIGQTKNIVDEELTGSKLALIDDHRLPKLPSTDSECLENKVIPQPSSESKSAPSPTSIHSGCERSQNNAPELVSGGSGSAVGQLSNGEDLNDEKLQQESLAQQQHRKVLSHQPGTAHVNSTTSEMPEAVSIVKLRDDMSFNDDLNKLSSGNDMKMRDSKSEDNGCRDIDCQRSGLDCVQTGGECLEPVSDKELQETVHVVASSSCVQGLLETEQDVSDCENYICNIPHTCRTLVDTANNPTTPEASRVSFGCSDSAEVGRAKHYKRNNDLSPCVTQVGLASLQPTSLETKCGSSHNSNGTHANPQCAESERTIDIHSPIIVNSLPLSQDRTDEFVEAGTLPATSSCRVPEMPSHCEPVASESCNTFLQLKFSHEESNMAIDLPQQQAAHVHIGSSDKRATTNAETVNIEDSDSSNGENVSIELSEHEGSENMSQGSRSRNRIPMTDTNNKQATANVIDLPEELDYEEGGVGTQSAVVDERLNGDDGQHEEGESSDRDEGELSDDDVEEGEIKEPGSKKSQLKSACPFLQKGGCTWGAACRFLHPGVNDKGNYQMLEVSGFSSPASRALLDNTDLWPKLPETLPPKVQEVPLSETAWERGLRLAREKKATERRGQEPGSEANQLGKESEQLSKFLPRLPYYDRPAYEEDVYYKSPRDLLQVGQYEGFQARHNQHYSYQDMSSAPYVNVYSPLEKFDRNGLDQREHFRPGAAPLSRGYTPPPLKRPDEWIDPWMRSKSPLKDKKQSVSRGKRRRRSKSDYSHSSRSSSGSSSSSSRSSRSASNSSASSRDQSQSATAARGPGGFDSGYYKGGYQQGGYRGGSYGGAGPGIVYAGRNVRNRSKDRFGRRTDRSTPDRPLPYARPRHKSGSSDSDSSSSRSRSRRRKPSSRSSRSSSRSPASKGNKTSQPTTKGPQPGSLPYPPFRLDQIPQPSDPRPPLPGPPAAARPESAGPKAQQALLKPKDPQKPVIQKPSVKLTIVPKQPALDSRPNPLNSPPPKQEQSDDDVLAIQPNPLDSPPSKQELSDDDVLVIQPNPLDSPPPMLELSDDDVLPIQPNPMDSPSLKRQLSDDDVIVVSAILPAKKVNLPTTPLVVQRSKSGRARKNKQKISKAKSPLSAPHSAPSSDVPRVKAHRVKVPGGLSKHQSSKAKSQMTEAAATKTPLASTASSKLLKNMPTSRKELLKQLKEVEKAIARKKSQLQ